jgi:phosphohistidine phosphatase
MKTIWFMRHAKSDWSDPSLADFDRPLNQRGMKDAPLMGRWIKAGGQLPDLIISSPATRARLTALSVAKACHYDRENIEWWEDFYPGDVGATLDHLKRAAPGKEHILLIGHNPALEELVSCLTSSRKLWLKLPTAAIAMLSADIDGWTQLGPGKCQMTGLIAPKFLKAFQ